MTFEVVIFKLQPNVAAEDFQSAINATTELLKTQAGFISRTVAQSEGGEWLDILKWESVEAGKKASTIFQTEPEGQRFSGYMSPDGIQVYFLENAIELQ